MAEPIGVLNVCVVHGANLAIADPLTHTSDPFVVLHYASQVPIFINPTLPVKLEVFDEDTFTADDSMGVGEFNVTDIFDAARMNLRHVPSETRIKTIYPVGANSLARESHVVWKDGKVVQDIVLKLSKVETGLIELQLQWVHASGAKQ